MSCPVPVAEPTSLTDRLAQLTLADAHRLRRRAARVAGMRGAERSRAQADLDHQLERAEARVAARRAAVPTIRFPEQLPVSARVDDLAAAIEQHQVVVVAGETGSGKSTQLPKVCLQLGRGVRGMVGHTQPRRIAARALAERIAQETDTALGEAIGYSVRFGDHTGPRTLVKLMTDGILLAEIGRDPDLLAYDTIIVDEAHERSLNIDFLLGYLVRLLPRRPDLKVIITSATIDPHRFARHFTTPERPVPVVEVSGRTFPVDIRYLPWGSDAETDDPDDPDDPDAVPEPVRRAPAAGDGAPVDQGQAIVEAVDELWRTGDGDVLVFLSGEREITDTADLLRAHLATRPYASEVLPLYGRLSAADQHRVFSRATGRRVVLSTNVAETSLTVPGIRYVVDPGTARISRYSPRTKVQRLPIEKVSQASAGQRAGRCGRVADGICIRLYSEQDFAERPEFTDPEIVRTSLAAVILRMASLRLGDISTFPFIDPPDRRLITDGITVLTELGALQQAPKGSREVGASEGGTRPSGTGQDSVRLTEIGRSLAALPVDPRLARMIVEGDRQSCLAELLVIASGLTVVDVRERPLEEREQAVAAHSRFVDPTSDFLTLLNLWHHLQEQGRTLSGNAFRRMCKREYLHHLRIREWQDLHGQLEQAARGLGLRTDSSARVGLTIEPGGTAEDDTDQAGSAEDHADTAPRRRRGNRPPSREPARSGQPVRGSLAVPLDGSRIHTAVLSGLLSHVAVKPEVGREYQGTRGSKWMVWPGSAVAKALPPLVVAAELVETSRLWGRTVARVQPEEIEQVGGDLLRRSWSEPRWNRRRGSVEATEKVMLLGLTIVAARTVQYDRIDRPLSRELFIRSALVQGEWDARHPFLARNREAVAEVLEWEDRTRRRDLLDDEVVFGFYDARLPADITSARRFDAWWKRRSRTDPDLLTFTAQELLRSLDEADVVDERAFPDRMAAGDVEVDLQYRYDPSRSDDGVSVTIPLAVLARVDPAAFDRQVPGLQVDLAVALIRSLPKAVRRQYVPAPDFARAAVARLESGEQGAGSDSSQPFPVRLARALTALTGTPLQARDFDVSKVPDHLRLTFKVVDERGEQVEAGKDLAAIQARLRADTQQAVTAEFDRVAGAAGRTGLTEFPADGLPRSATSRVDGHEVRAYPALVDRGDSVDLVVFTDEAAQLAAHRTGVRRLVVLGTRTPISLVRRGLTRDDQLALAVGPHGSLAGMVADAVQAAVDALLDWAGPLPWTRAEFDRTAARIAPHLDKAVLDVLRAGARVLEAARETAAAIDAVRGTALTAQAADLRRRQAELVGPDFLSRTGAAGLPDLVRYVQALGIRARRVVENPERDRERQAEADGLEREATAALARRREARGMADLDPLVAEAADPAARELRRLLAEHRVALFAQPMRTAVPVSAKRISAAVAALD